MAIIILLVIDANVLVGEILRPRGRALLTSDRLGLAITEPALREARHEVAKRLAIMLDRARIGQGVVDAIRQEFLDAVPPWLHVLPTAALQAQETVARRRVPRDPDDWSTVAAALALEVGIWTNDADFLGCGCPTWTTDTLLAELAS